MAASRVHTLVQLLIATSAHGMQGFVYQLKVHLLRRLSPDGSFVDGREPTSAELASVQVYEDKIYIHKTMRVNYTSYNVRRHTDSLNIANRRDVMVLADDQDIESTGHPYWYARIIKQS